MLKRIWNKERAKELRNEGLTYKEVAKIINLEAGNATPGSKIHYSLIYSACNPNQAKAKSEHQTKKQQNGKRRNVDYKGGCCQMTGDQFPAKKCGYNKSMAALTFHHLVKEDKSFAISNARHLPWKIVEPELKKCILLCANCHSEVHAGKHSDVMEAFTKEYKENVRPFLTPDQLVKGSAAARGNSILPKMSMQNGKLVVEKAQQRKEMKLNEAGTAYCDIFERRTLQDNYKAMKSIAVLAAEPPNGKSTTVFKARQGELWEDISYEHNQREKIPR